jgi:hypothetical protein
MLPILVSAIIKGGANPRLLTNQILSHNISSHYKIKISRPYSKTDRKNQRKQQHQEPAGGRGVLTGEKEPVASPWWPSKMCRAVRDASRLTSLCHRRLTSLPRRLAHRLSAMAPPRVLAPAPWLTGKKAPDRSHRRRGGAILPRRNLAAPGRHLTSQPCRLPRRHSHRRLLALCRVSIQRVGDGDSS